MHITEKQYLSDCNTKQYTIDYNIKQYTNDHNINSTLLIITLNTYNTQSFMRCQWLLSFLRYSQEFNGT
jgi:hypothetical protein